MNKRILQQCVQIAISKNTPDGITEWGNYHHFSFIVQKGKIIGVGTNKAATPLGQYPKTSKIHSEPDAYFNSIYKLDKTKTFDLVNIRLSKTNEFKISAPCKCCYSFMEKLNCRNVYFTVEGNLNFAKITLDNE